MFLVISNQFLSLPVSLQKSSWKRAASLLRTYLWYIVMKGTGRKNHLSVIVILFQHTVQCISFRRPALAIACYFCALWKVCHALCIRWKLIESKWFLIKCIWSLAHVTHGVMVYVCGYIYNFWKYLINTNITMGKCYLMKCKCKLKSQSRIYGGYNG